MQSACSSDEAPEKRCYEHEDDVAHGDLAVVLVFARDKEVHHLIECRHTLSRWLSVQTLVTSHLVFAADVAFGKEYAGALDQPFENKLWRAQTARDNGGVFCLSG